MPNINCSFYNYVVDNFQEFEFDLNENVYPCCHYYLDFLKNNNIHPDISHIDISLKTNSLKNIYDEFHKIINPTTWSSNNCPKLCKQICEQKK